MSRIFGWLFLIAIGLSSLAVVSGLDAVLPAGWQTSAERLLLIVALFYLLLKIQSLEEQVESLSRKLARQLDQ